MTEQDTQTQKQDTHGDGHELLFVWFFFAFFLFRAKPTACGSSRARGRITNNTVSATATQDPSRVCNLHHSSGQHRLLNPQSESRDRTPALMEMTTGSSPAEPQWELQWELFPKPGSCVDSEVVPERTGTAENLPRGKLRQPWASGQGWVTPIFSETHSEG